MTAALRLYWSPDSANLVVRIALHRLGLTFDAIRVNRGRGEQRGEDFLALNPQGLLPVLVDGETVLFETGAIVLHLADRVGSLGPDAPPADDRAARAHFLRWLFYIANTLHADLRIAFYTHRYVPREMVSTLRQGLRRRFAGHLDLVEAEIARQGALTGARATLVDDYLGVCVRWAQNYPAEDGPVLNSVAPWPHLAQLLARLEGEEAVRTACTEEAIFEERPYTQPSRPNLSQAEITG